ncbi:MAG: hypothetical protein LBR79_06445 [Oscillospiraceae bacterium]|nr:hypothetical protein [Oscillospiraceae bacterium]
MAEGKNKMSLFRNAVLFAFFLPPLVGERTKCYCLETQYYLRFSPPSAGERTKCHCLETQYYLRSFTPLVGERTKCHCLETQYYLHFPPSFWRGKEQKVTV